MHCECQSYGNALCHVSTTSNPASANIASQDDNIEH